MDSRSRRVVAVAVLAALVSACSSVSVVSVAPAATSSSLPAASPAASAVAPAASAVAPAAVTAAGLGGMPVFAHVYLLVLENEEYGSLVGNSEAPYLNSLIAEYGLASNYDAVAHPSQPNYVALLSGSTQGVTDDANHDLAGTNLLDQIEAHGKTWTVFAQDYPGNCFKGASHAGKGNGIGAAGSYARKHNPAISFTDVAGNPARCAQITDMAAFDPAASSFEMIVPNLCNDMHSCPIATGDAFLQAFVPLITSSPAFADSVLFITTDEGTTDAGGGGKVATLVVSPLVTPGFASATSHDHYSLLRSIEDSWNLGCLGQACSATNVAEFFGRAPAR